MTTSPRLAKSGAQPAPTRASACGDNTPASLPEQPATKETAMNSNHATLNALWLLATARAHAALATLTQRGFSVIGVELANPARPTLRIEPSPQCLALLERGEAAWFSFGQGQPREGQFALDGCRVVWTDTP